MEHSNQNLRDSRQEDRKQVLEELIQNGTRYHIDYSGYLSNHLVHGLVALYKLGASSTRLKEFYSTYVLSLEPSIPSQHEINSSNWKEFLGTRQGYRDYCDFFRSEASSKGTNEMLNEYFPQLIEGLSGSAFHGLIQLGYAIESGIDNIICDGIAYLAFAYHSLGKLNNPSENKPADLQSSSCLAILKQVHDNTAFKGIFEPDMRFQDKMKMLDYVNIAKYDLPEDFVPTTVDIDAVVQLFLRVTVELFAFTKDSNDFFLLHGVTSFQALKVVLSKIEDRRTQIEALRYFWKAAVATYICQGMPTIRDSQETEIHSAQIPEWKELIETVIACDNEHLIKLVYVCHREEERGSLLYRFTCWKAITTVLNGKGYAHN